MIWTKIKLFNQKRNLNANSSEAGFTIIESLMAIIVVAILMSAIAPAILLSLSTRLQARRVELASDAARAYIDALRAKRIELPASVGRVTVAAGQTPLGNFAVPPAANLNCPRTNDYCTTNPVRQLFCVDGDGDNRCLKTSNKDFVLQTFQYTKPPATGAPPLTADDGYQLGVRVYRADAFNTTAALKKSPEKQSSYTGGLGDPKVPYFETTTEISSNATSFSDFCDRLDPRPAGSTAINPNQQSKCR